MSTIYMRKFLLLFFSIILILTGCDTKQNTNDKVMEIINRKVYTVASIDSISKLIKSSDDLTKEQVNALRMEVGDFIREYAEHLCDSLNDRLNDPTLTPQETQEQLTAINNMSEPSDKTGVGVFYVEGYVTYDISPLFIADILGIPDSFSIHEPWSVIMKISSVVGIFSSLAVILSALFAYLQWRKVKYENKVQLVELIREKLYDDKEVRHVFYLIDYGVHWYDASFHESKEPQGSIDKTLSIIEYVCYMYNNKIIKPKEFELIKYNIDRITQNNDVQEYLWNLYHWCGKIKSRCSFINLINYALDNSLWKEDFKDPKCQKYHKYLNF